MIEFGFWEVIKRVDILGPVLVLLVYGSDPELREYVRSLWPFRSRAGVSAARPAASSPA